MTTRSTRLALLASILLSLSVPIAGSLADAADWPGLRGRDGLGVSSEEKLPSTWSEKKNVLWTCDLPEWGNSSPCVVGDRVYLTSQTKDTALIVMSIDAKSGRKVWSVPIGKGTKKAHKLHNMASPTSVANGRRVWALFGPGALVCLDTAGKKVWSKNLEKTYGEYKVLWGMATSPRLHNGRLLVACMNGGPSYVVALDQSTGEQVWKTERKLPCVGEAVDSYSSPILLTRGKTTELVVAGADHVDGYDIASGKRSWISSGLSIPHEYGRSIASPTAGGGMVYAVSSGYGGLGRVLAVDVSKDLEGDVSETHRRWAYEKHSPDCPSPVYYGGYVFIVRDNGVGSCIEAKTGELKWRERLFRGDCKASPIAGDGKIYFTSIKGETLVLEVGPERKDIARNRLDARIIATPAISNGTIFLRSRTKLYAIAEGGQAGGK